MLLRYFLGDDIFISYSREDGRQYAANLKEQLQSMDYSCFIDYEKVYPGDHLGSALERAIRRSRVFVLVGTKGVRGPESWVPKEVAAFKKTGRKIVPINIGEALTAPMWEVIAGDELVWVDEESEENPSPIVFDEIKRLFKHNRRNVWVRGAITAAALTLLAVSVIAFWQASEAKANQRKAEERTTQLLREQDTVARQTQELEARRRELEEANRGLERKQEELESKTREAEEEREHARESARKAREQEQAARRNAQRAREQQQLAEDRQRTAASLELASHSVTQLGPDPVTQLPADPELSVVLANEALTRYTPTARAEEALRHSLLTFPRRAMMSGHRLEVSSVEFSPDGRYVVTASKDNTARVWEAAGREVRVLNGHTGPVNSASYSPDGRLILTSSLDATARVWDAATGRELRVLSGHGKAGWDARYGTGGVLSAKFSPDGKSIVTASNDDTARVWDVETGKELRVISGHEGDVFDASFSPDGKLIFTVSTDHSVCVWDAATGDRLKKLEHEGGIIYHAAFSPDSKLVVTAGSPNVAVVWELETDKSMALRGHTETLSCASFSRDGNYIVTAADDGSARVWETHTGKELAVLKGTGVRGGRAEFTPDGEFVMTYGSYLGRTAIWDPRRGSKVATLGESPTSARLSPDGRFVAIASGNRVSVEETVPRKGVVSFPATGLYGAAISPDGKLVVTVASLTLQTWDPIRGRSLKILEESEGRGGAWSVALSRDGKLAVSGHLDGRSQIWDVESGRRLRTLYTRSEVGDGVRSVSFSRDDKLIFTINRDNTAGLWDAGTGVQLALITKHGAHGVGEAVLSPDSRRIVTVARCDAYEETPARESCNEAWVWDATANLRMKLRGHTARVTKAAFSPDGALIVTAGQDKTARMWEAHTGKELMVLKGHEGEVF
ncbi:MAG TPA: TIR domain-containing protein, partial [Pyrinomonadaceae bacterium]|nr:TIR domain-containing protein [Pyrinomonadaceae bacterium]